MKICDIKIGGRHREDLGDIDSLADSIKRVGLLHPPVVTEQGTLIAGERRLEAVKKLGRDEVPVTVAKNLDDIYKCLIAERDENECRLKMTPPESVALSQSLEPYERKAAAERKAATRRIGNSSRPVNFTDREKGEAKDKSHPSPTHPTRKYADELLAVSGRLLTKGEQRELYCRGVYAWNAFRNGQSVQGRLRAKHSGPLPEAE
jgi:hypothetical protein